MYINRFIILVKKSGRFIILLTSGRFMSNKKNEFIIKKKTRN